MSKSEAVRRDRAVVNHMTRTNFVLFILRVFQTVSPGDLYIHGEYIEAIAHKLEQCRSRKCRRLILNTVPRGLKSVIASVAWPAWLLGHDPTLRIICVSYGSDLSIRLARDCRAVMTSDWYRAAFPKTLLKQGESADERFMTTRRGFRHATSMQGGITGFGADIIIVDDPIKQQDVHSAPLRQAMNDAFRQTIMTRLNDRKNGIVVLVMHRLHLDDLAGNLLEKGGWESLVLPAIAETDLRVPLGGGEWFCRKRGDVLHPERETREDLERLRHEHGSYTFAALFQQSPIPVEGNLFKLSWFDRYESLPHPSQCSLVVQSWDTAQKAGDTNDYSVCTTWLVADGHYYLAHVRRDRLEFSDLRRAVLHSAAEFGAGAILIEDSGTGTPLIQVLGEDSRLDIIPITSKLDKVTRALQPSSMVEARKVHLPIAAAWLAEFEQELARFPGGRHDDQVDSMVQALNWLADRSASIDLSTLVLDADEFVREEQY